VRRTTVLFAVLVGFGLRGEPVEQGSLLFQAIRNGDLAFVKAHLTKTEIDVRVAPSLDEAVRKSDVVVTCTTARMPILEPRHLHPGLFIAAVGADNPQKQELAPELLRDSKVVADILEQAATMGELHHAIAGGLVTRDDVHGELADVICGRVRGRERDDEVIIFDSTGTALQDAAVAALAYERAVERAMGITVALAD